MDIASGGNVKDTARGGRKAYKDSDPWRLTAGYLYVACIRGLTRTNPLQWGGAPYELYLLLVISPLEWKFGESQQD